MGHRLHKCSQPIYSSQRKASEFIFTGGLFTDKSLKWCLHERVIKKKVSVLQSPSVSTSCPLSVCLRPLGVKARSPIIRLTPMLCQSVLEDHTHYPCCCALVSTQRPCFHLVIWVRLAHQSRRPQWDMEMLQPLSADISAPFSPDYTAGFRVNTWQEQNFQGPIRHIISPRHCQWCTVPGGFSTQLSQRQNRDIYVNGIFNRVDAWHCSTVVLLARLQK